jgi:dihydroorotate dehydrogenase
MYSLLRPFLFCLDPEQAHQVSTAGLDLAYHLGLSRLIVGGGGAGGAPDTPVRLMGLDFPNRVGLAAGLDKNGDHIDALAALGFGFIEVGSVTPRPQPGNPRPRIFRLTQAKAIINRLGFNNLGVDYLVANLQRMRFRGVLGVNIGKNLDTPIADAERDYLLCLERVYAYASYVTVNVSSPNTKNLRQLQAVDALESLLAAIVRTRDRLARVHGKTMPLALKIAPDLNDEEIGAIARLLIDHGIEAVIATNTTIARDAVEGLPHGDEAGGLSGAPVFESSNRVIRLLAGELAGRVPIIGAGGILSGAQACAKRDAGADLVQIYSGLVYRGPQLISEIRRAFAALPAAA